jgi:hypothetical protein
VKFVDISGEKYGRWNILSLWGFKHTLWRDANGVRHESMKAFFNARCECGTERVVSSNSLRKANERQRSRSCGCYRDEQSSKRGKETMLKYWQRKRETKMAKAYEVRELEAKLAELREQYEGADVTAKVELFQEINRTEQLLNMAVDRHKEIRTGKVVGPGNANYEAWVAKS